MQLVAQRLPHFHFPNPRREPGSYFFSMIFDALRCRELATRPKKAGSARSHGPFGIAESARCL
jgi:hypothetical protein